MSGSAGGVPPTTSGSPAAPPPVPVRWAAVGVVGEGVAALGAAIAYAVAGAAPFAVWGFIALLGLAVGGAGVALFRGVRGARGPALVAQLLLLGIAYYAAVPSGRPEWGVPAAVLAIAVLTGLLGRAGRDWAGS